MENNLMTQALPESDDDEISLLDLLQTVVDNLRLLVLGPLLVGISALGVSFLIAPTFTAEVRFLPPQQQQSAVSSMLSSLGGLAGLAGAAAGIKSPNDQYLAFLKSATVQDALIARFDLKQRYEQEFMVNTRNVLGLNLNATSGKDGIIQLEVDDKDPTFAANLANAHVEELAHLLDRLAVTDAQQRRVFFDKQLQITKGKLVAAEKAMLSAGVNSSMLKASPSSAISAVASLKAQVTSQEVKLGAMRGYLADTAPEYKLALNELANFKNQLQRLEQAEPTLSDSTKQGAKPKDDYTSLYREFKYQESLLELFTKQFDAAKLDEAREGSVIQVIDVATPPELKSKPKKALIAMLATLASGFLLLLFVFVRQALRNASQTEETAERMAALGKSWRKVWGR